MKKFVKTVISHGSAVWGYLTFEKPSMVETPKLWFVKLTVSTVLLSLEGLLTVLFQNLFF